MFITYDKYWGLMSSIFKSLRTQFYINTTEYKRKKFTKEIQM